eukprot:g13833.t1
MASSVAAPGAGGVGAFEKSRRRRRLCVCTRIHQNNADRPVDLAKVREFLDTALLYADSIAIAVGSPTPRPRPTPTPPPSPPPAPLATAAPGSSEHQANPDQDDNPSAQQQGQELSLLQQISGVARVAEQEAMPREWGVGVGGDGQEEDGVAGVAAVSVFEVSPWGKFTPALNALLGFAARDGAELVIFQSLETTVAAGAVRDMEAHMGVDDLVVGAALTGHAFQGGETVELTGITTPWNTLALWDVTKLAKLGFLGVAEGLLPGVPAGVEEVTAIATLQALLGAEHARAKLVRLSQVQWQTAWEDEGRRKWHESKMSSKLDRAERQMLALGIKRGVVTHLGAFTMALNEKRSVALLTTHRSFRCGIFVSCLFATAGLAFGLGHVSEQGDGFRLPESRSEGSAAALHLPDVPGPLIGTGAGATAKKNAVINTRANLYDEDKSSWGVEDFDALVLNEARRLSTDSSAACDGTSWLIGDGLCNEGGYQAKKTTMQPVASMEATAAAAIAIPMPPGRAAVRGFKCLDPDSACYGEEASCTPWNYGSGVCQDSNNNAACTWDGGDCCSCDCDPNADYTCGSQGFNCLNPDSACFGEEAACSPWNYGSGVCQRRPTVGLTPAPTIADTPGPTAGLTPAPTTDETPAPAIAQTPGPTALDTPGPTAELTPAPTIGDTPGPTAGLTPAPTAGETPGPTAGLTPAPTIGDTPGPTTGLTPAPTAGETPGPTAGLTPAPTIGDTPGPTAGLTPAPTAGETPGPTAGLTPAPTIGDTPGPTAGLTPAPTAGETPAPSIAQTPGPTALDTPGPTAGLTPAPTIGDTPGPAAGLTPAPTAGETPAPSIAQTPGPTALDTPGPTAGLTPAPTIGDTPGPTGGGTIAPTIADTPGPTVDGTRAPTTVNTRAPGSVVAQDVVGEVRTSSPGVTPRVEQPQTVAPTIAPLFVQEVPEDPVTTVASVTTVGGVVAATVGTVVGGTATGSSPVVAGSTGQGTSSFRTPSSTIGFLLTSQIQFLATLSLVDNTGDEDSAVSKFADSLRWVNLWPSQNFSRSVTPEFVAKDLEESKDDEDTSSGDKGISLTIISDVSSFLFMGNLALFFGGLVVIFTVHVLVASGVEAYWLAKRNAQEVLKRAHDSGVSLGDLSAIRSGRRSQLSDVDAGSFQSESSDTALFPKNSVRGHSWFSRQKGGGRGNTDDDEEYGEPHVKRANGRMGEISQCREISQSPWLHFPHLELVFLIFAFEGAVTSQVSALKDTNSSKVFYMAAATLVLYPALMLIMTARTYCVRVHSDALIVFNPKDDPADPAASSTVFSKVASGWKKDHSLFTWADKGQWETVETTDEDTKREAAWFRIGFEPLFADFTKAGSWFIVYTLVEWAVLACIGVLCNDSMVQLGLFCALHSVTFLLLVLCKPFANSIINGMGACVMAIDAVSMGMLAAFAGESDGTAGAKRVDAAVTVIQQLALFALVLPLYVDTFFVLLGAVRKRNQRAKKRYSASEREERDFILRCTLRMWGPTWCRMHTLSATRLTLVLAASRGWAKVVGAGAAARDPWRMTYRAAGV